MGKSAQIISGKRPTIRMIAATHASTIHIKLKENYFHCQNRQYSMKKSVVFCQTGGVGGDHCTWNMKYSKNTENCVCMFFLLLCSTSLEKWQDMETTWTHIFALRRPAQNRENKCSILAIYRLVYLHIWFNVKFKIDPNPFEQSLE